MPRSPLTRSRPLRSLALVGLVAAAVVGVVIATMPAPLPPAIADPREVLLRAADAARDAGSAHYLGAIAGSVSLDRSGASEPIELEGSTLEGDVDLRGAGGDGAATATLTMTGLGKALEAVIVGKEAWLRVGLLGGGWRRSAAAESPFSFLADPAAVTTGLGAFIDGLPAGPRMEIEESCGETRCYVVAVDLSSGAAPGILGGLVSGLATGAGGLFPGGPGASGSPFPFPLPSAASDGTFPLPPEVAGGGEVRVSVERASLRPVRLRFLMDAGASGTISIDVALTDWGEPVAIAPPG